MNIKVRIFLAQSILCLWSLFVIIGTKGKGQGKLSQAQKEEFPRSGSLHVGKKFTSACLLLMDDNHWLVEWLAYHYAVVTLRSLIVAVDPRSITSPLPILQRWRGLIDYELWNDNTFGFDPISLNDQKPSLQDVNLDRQRTFYAQCLRRHKELGHSWVFLTDTDEFIFPNTRIVKKNHSLHRPGVRQSDLHRPGFILNFLNNEAKKKNTKCLAMGRMQLNSFENSSLHESTELLGDDFDEKDFLTTRWRYIGGDLVGPKNILDISSIPYSSIAERAVDNQHRVIPTICPKAKNFWNQENSILQIFHYFGTSEQFSFRDDPRKSIPDAGRNSRRERFKAITGVTEVGTGTWIQHFLHQMGGTDTAKIMLEGVGNVHGWKPASYHQTSFSRPKNFTSEKKHVFFSRARNDRSDAVILDMLFAHAYGYEHNMAYGGACFEGDPSIHQNTTSRLIKSIGLQNVVLFACPKSSNMPLSEIFQQGNYFG